MKTEIKLLTPLVFAFLVFTQGCEPSASSSKESSFRPTQNGFGVVVKGIGIDSGPGAKLYYKGTNETPVLVWPCIGTHGDPILYTNDVAVLLADKPNNRGIGGSVFIVVQQTGPAMDISQDVLKLVAEQAHVDFKKALKACQPLRLIKMDEKLKVVYLANPLAEPDIPNLEETITWEQVFEIMQDVKKTGKIEKVVNADVPYLQKHYDSK